LGIGSDLYHVTNPKSGMPTQSELDGVRGFHLLGPFSRAKNWGLGGPGTLPQGFLIGQRTRSNQIERMSNRQPVFGLLRLRGIEFVPAVVVPLKKGCA